MLLKSDFLKHVLESNVDDICATCPFLVERAAVAVISAAIHLMKDPLDSRSREARGVQLSISSTAVAAQGPPASGSTPSVAIWTSIRLLREVPHEVMANIADRIGAGLVTFIRYCVVTTFCFSISQRAYLGDHPALLQLLNWSSGFWCSVS